MVSMDKQYFEDEKIIYDDIIYQADVEVTSHYDANYGQDADGNRGEGRLMITDVSVSNIRFDSDDKFIPVTDLELKEIIKEKFNDMTEQLVSR